MQVSTAGSSAGSDSTRFFKVLLSYRGTEYNGWQFQPHDPSVEGELRRAISQLTKSEFDTSGASRTDAGVHACGQCCLVSMSTNLETTPLARALHALTPDDIAVLSVSEVDEGFQPSSDAVEKRYAYRIHNSAVRSPFASDLQWWYPKPLDVAKMAEAARYLEGTHDFDAFRNASKDPPENFVRTVHSTDWTVRGDRLTFQAIGDGFLYKMVRNIVGTLVQVGVGRRDTESVVDLLRSRDRSSAGQTAPPEGLYLMQIRYPTDPALEIDADPMIPG